MYVVIVGAGRIGRRLMGLALRDEHDVAVFDIDAARATEVAKAYDVVVYGADATQEANLEEADVEAADVVFATTRHDPVNLMVVTLARRMGVDRCVSVVNHDGARPLFQNRGATVIGNPSQVAAEHLLYAARHPGVARHVPVTEEVEILQVAVEEGSPLADRDLRGAPLPQGVLVAAVERQGAFVFPRADTRILPGDFVTLLAHVDVVGEVLRSCRSGGVNGGR